MTVDIRENDFSFNVSINNGHFMILLKAILSVDEEEAIKSRNIEKILKVLIDYRKRVEAQLRVITSYIEKYEVHK